jgi:hypothetical protein
MSIGYQEIGHPGKKIYGRQLISGVQREDKMFWKMMPEDARGCRKMIIY